MNASNLALRVEDEPVVMAEVPRLGRAVITGEANEPRFARPRLSLEFRDRHFNRQRFGSADSGWPLFRVR